MTTYLHCLDSYNRYQRIPQTIKWAELANGHYWELGPLHGGQNGAQYFTEDNEGWTNDEAFNALFSKLSPQQQQSYLQSGSGKNINSLMAMALANPQAYGDMLTYVVKDQELALQGKRSALSTVLDQNPFAKQVVDQIRAKTEKNKSGLTGKLRNITGSFSDGIVRDHAISGVQEYMNGTAPQQGQPQQAQAPSGQAPATQPNGAQAGGDQQNPSMWSYMLPALAAGAPLALLGGLGGGSKWGLGLLGAAGLAGLGYGMARHNGWDGWSPINNFADTVNGWFGMGGQQNAQNQQSETAPTEPTYREGLQSLGKDKNGYERFYAGPGAISGYNDGGKGVNVYYDPNKKSYMAEDTYWDTKLNNFTPYATSTPASNTTGTTPPSAPQGREVYNNTQLPPAQPFGPQPSGNTGPQKPAGPMPGPNTAPQNVPVPQQKPITPMGPPKPSTTKKGGFLPNPRALGTGYNNLKKMTAPQNPKPVQQPAPQPAAQKPAFNPRMIGTGSQNYKQLTAPKTTQAPQAPKTIDPRWMGTGYQNYRQLTVPPATQQQQTPAQEKQNPKTTWPWGISPANLRI